MTETFIQGNVAPYRKRIAELENQVGHLRGLVDHRDDRIAILTRQVERLRKSLDAVREALQHHPVFTFSINPDGGRNIWVEGHDRFAFGDEVEALLTAIRSALAEEKAP